MLFTMLLTMTVAINASASNSTSQATCANGYPIAEIEGCLCPSCDESTGRFYQHETDTCVLPCPKGYMSDGVQCFSGRPPFTTYDIAPIAPTRIVGKCPQGQTPNLHDFCRCFSPQQIEPPS